MRAAILQHGQWVELAVEVAESIDSPTGKTVAILGHLGYATAGLVSVPAGLVGECTLPRDPLKDGGAAARKQHGIILDTPAPLADTAPPEPSDAPAPPFLFTLELTDGTHILNQSTMKGGDVEGARAVVLATWGAMTGSRPGKACIEAHYQADGRVGEDQPAVPAATTGEPATMYRWAKADHAESMDTATDITGRDDLLEVLRVLPGFEGVTDDMVTTQHMGVDDRCGWDTWAVLVQGHPVGMTNGAL